MDRLKTKSVVLKLWQEELLDNAVVFRGEVRDPITRKTKYFDSWSQLQTILANYVISDPKGKGTGRKL